jgi:anti-anti-sigma regulatory factor
MAGVILQPPPSISVRTIAEFADGLTAALSEHPAVTVDLAGVTHPDLNLLQLIEAARRQATETGRDFALSAPATDALAAVLDRAGFTAGFSAEDRQFWYHGVSAR